MGGYTEKDKANFAALSETYARIRAEECAKAASRFWGKVTQREIQRSTRIPPVGWF